MGQLMSADAVNNPELQNADCYNQFPIVASQDRGDGHFVFHTTPLIYFQAAIIIIISIPLIRQTAAH